MQAVPMLSNPPALVLLALVVGLGAYLRQVAENAAKLLDEINEGRHPTMYPQDAERTQIKVRSLENTREKLNGLVAPIMIWVSVFTTARLVLQVFRCFPS